MRLFPAVVIFCLLAVSCANKNKIKVPQDVLCQDTMVGVLTDIHLAKASQQLGIAIDSADTGKHDPFQYVWKKHHITEDDYKKSLDFYAHNPNVLDSIYENVLNDLSKQKAQLL